MEAFANYFSENLLQVQPEQSVKKSIKMVEDTAQKIAERILIRMTLTSKEK